MTRLLGRVDLRGAQLEQLPDGFVVHDRLGVKVRAFFAVSSVCVRFAGDC